MTKRIDNPWWSEGWRLVRARLPEVVRGRRRFVLVGVGAGAAILGLVGSVLIASALELTPTSRAAAFVVLESGGAAGGAMAVVVWIIARRDRSRSHRVGDLPLSLGAVFDLSRPLSGVTPADRKAVESSIAQQRRELPEAIIGSLLYGVSFVLVLLGLVLTGTGGLFVWFWLAWTLVMVAASPLASLKVLANTTPILERLDATPEPPTYRGPKAWGIEAARKATEGDATAG